MKRIAITHDGYHPSDLASGVVVVRGSPERLRLEGKLVSRVRQTIADGPAVRQKKGLTRSNESVPEILSRLRSGKFINTLNGTNVQLLTTTWRYQLWTRENTNGCGLRSESGSRNGVNGQHTGITSTAGTSTPCGLCITICETLTMSCVGWFGLGGLACSARFSRIVRFCRKAECLLPLKVGGIPPFGTLTRVAAASQSGPELPNV